MTIATRDPAQRGPRPVLIAVVAVLLGGLLAGSWLLAARAAHTAPPAAPQPSAQEQLEEVVAAQPDDVEARRRLGDLHFAADRFDAALEHYLVVLEHDPDQPETLARTGWIAFEGGEPDDAHRLVTRSLRRSSADPEALWYAAQIRLYGLDDEGGAIKPLRRLLARDDLTAAFRREIRQVLAVARGSSPDSG